jgi:hypothetical protein
MTTPKNPRQPVTLGPTGRRVSERLKAVRGGMSLRDLADELAKIGHPISADGLSKIETGKRRVDVDDLVALAIALDVSPARLLLPAGKPDDEVTLTKKVTAKWESAWAWAQGERALPEGNGRWLSDVPLNPAWEAEVNERAARWRSENAPHRRGDDAPLSAEDFVAHQDDFGEIRKAVREAAERVSPAAMGRYLSALASEQRFRSFLAFRTRRDQTEPGDD